MLQASEVKLFCGNESFQVERQETSLRQSVTANVESVRTARLAKLEVAGTFVSYRQRPSADALHGIRRAVVSMREGCESYLSVRPRARA